MPKEQASFDYFAQDGTVSRGSAVGGLLCSGFVIMFCVIGVIAALAVDGLVMILVGNAILAAHHPHYATAIHAIVIGAVGCPISATAAALVTVGLRACPWPCSKGLHGVLYPYYVTVGHTISSFLAGVIGTAVLQKAGVDLGEINAIRAGAAGALGSTIIGLIVLVVAFLSALCFGVSLFGLWKVDVLDKRPGDTFV